MYGRVHAIGGDLGRCRHGGHDVYLQKNCPLKLEGRKKNFCMDLRLVDVARVLGLSLSLDRSGIDS